MTSHNEDPLFQIELANDIAGLFRSAALHKARKARTAAGTETDLDRILNEADRRAYRN